MVSMGFEQQIRSILAGIRPDRQLLLFSATFPQKIVHLAMDLMDFPVRVAVGRSGRANVNIQQEIVVMRVEYVIYHNNQNMSQKMDWLKHNIAEAELKGKVLIFVSTREASAELMMSVRHVTTAAVDCIHGDRPQYERSEVMNRFKQGKLRILIATDVAARGLDVDDIRTVINFDVPGNVDTYVHRIGRTCRTNETGEASQGSAVTLFTRDNKQFAAQLSKYYRTNQQTVPPALQALAAGVAETDRGRRSGGLGFNSGGSYGSRRDTFAGYFMRPIEPTCVVTPTTPSSLRTMYDSSTNTFSVVPVEMPPPTNFVAPVTTAVKGFVSGQDSLTDTVRMSEYGGPSDEWDSSKMALESALAAIDARRKEVETRDRSDSSRRRSEGRRRSRSRERSSRHGYDHQSRREHRHRSRSNSRDRRR